MTPAAGQVSDEFRVRALKARLFASISSWHWLRFASVPTPPERADMHIDHQAELQEKGYTKLEGVLSKDSAQELLRGLLAIQADQPSPAGDKTPFLNRGHDMLYNLQARDARYLRLFLDPPELKKLLIAALNDTWYKPIPQGACNFILRSLIARSGGPAPMPLHIDAFIPSSGTTTWAVQAAVVLEDQYPENGCTTVVPGSHRADRYADQAAVKSAVPISSKAGDIVMWDSRLWHGTTGNQTGKSRWSIVGTFVRWWIKQNYDITRSLPEAIYRQLNDEEKAVMGYCSIPPRDEFDRIDIKNGFADLKGSVAEFFGSK
jgi:hypothetical protein